MQVLFTLFEGSITFFCMVLTANIYLQENVKILPFSLAYN